MPRTVRGITDRGLCWRLSSWSWPSAGPAPGAGPPAPPAGHSPGRRRRAAGRRRRCPLCRRAGARRPGSRVPLPRRRPRRAERRGRCGSSRASSDARSDRRPAAPATARPARRALPDAAGGRPFDPPIGYTGPSSVSPSEGQQDPHFVPVEDRWRIGFPAWDRYGKGHPVNDDYPYMPGRLVRPVQPERPQGRLPDHRPAHVPRRDRVGRSRSRSSARSPRPRRRSRAPPGPNEQNFFGRPNQFFSTNFFTPGLRPHPRRRRLQAGRLADPARPDVQRQQPRRSRNSGSSARTSSRGRRRTREFWALQEAFFETKLADTSTDYDFASVRVGTQPFISDFRGFLFTDINRAVRLFGTRNANRDQYNLAYFRQWEKDTNSQLNTFNDRSRTSSSPTTTARTSSSPATPRRSASTYNNDPRSFKFDKNRFLVRPDPVGVARPHEVDVAYLGWAGDGHIGRFNLTHQFYWAFGRDSLNPLANQAQTINAQMFAIEGSYDRDWVAVPGLVLLRRRATTTSTTATRPASTRSSTAPNFAGGPFSYWNRQQIPLFGVNLVQRLSLVPDLRSSKFQGQANFVNPGLLLPTLGADFDLTPKLKMFNNVNFLWFDSTNVLEQFLFQGQHRPLHRHRPEHRASSTGRCSRRTPRSSIGASVLIPGQGFRDIYDNFSNRTGSAVLVGGFLVVQPAVLIVSSGAEARDCSRAGRAYVSSMQPMPDDRRSSAPVGPQGGAPAGSWRAGRTASRSGAGLGKATIACPDAMPRTSPSPMPRSCYRPSSRGGPSIAASVWPAAGIGGRRTHDSARIASRGSRPVLGSSAASSVEAVLAPGGARPAARRGPGRRRSPALARPARGRRSPCPTGRPRARPVEADGRDGRGQERRVRAVATRGRTTRTTRTRSGSAASTATAATRRPPTRRGRTSGRGCPEAWDSSANPVRSYTLLNHESPEFVRFVNPGDLRVAHAELRDDRTATPTRCSRTR